MESMNGARILADTTKSELLTFFVVPRQTKGLRYMLATFRTAHEPFMKIMSQNCTPLEGGLKGIVNRRETVGDDQLNSEPM